MRVIARILLVSFIESFATILVERAAYFFTHRQLQFSDALNLWLAAAFGVAYIAGALASHRLSLRAGEKRLLLAVVAGQMLVHLGMGSYPSAPAIFVGCAALGLLNGLKWPILESYVAAGYGPDQAAAAIGRFNISWALAVPLSLAVAGPVIEAWGSGLFFLAAGLNAVAVLLILPVAPRPPYLPHDHPHRPPSHVLDRYGRMLIASRWLMLLSYSSLWILAALMPHIFAGLGVGVALAAGLSGLVDVCRLTGFVVLGRAGGWYDRRWPLAAAMAALPVSFALVLWGPSLAAVLAGEVGFGLAAGTIYYSHLYYSMVIKNASVDAGGVHEGLIGLGFTVGPLLALAGGLLSSHVGEAAAISIGVLPLFLLCSAAAVAKIVGHAGSAA